jgi:hypothetical protein
MYAAHPVRFLQFGRTTMQVSGMHFSQSVVDGGHQIEHPGVDGVVGDTAEVHL